LGPFSPHFETESHNGDIWRECGAGTPFSC